MRRRAGIRWAGIGLMAVVGMWAGPVARAQDNSGPLPEGGILKLEGRSAVIQKADVLPYVENKFTKTCVFDTYDNPKLHELRTKYKLDEVVAAGRDEFDRQVLLMDWVREQIHWGDPKDRRGICSGLEIMKLSGKEQPFFCAQCAGLQVCAAVSLGWVCRPISRSNHTWTEMWSNQYGKWMMMDPTSKLYVEKDGVPLSTYEIRREWNERGGGKDLWFVYGAERRKEKKVKTGSRLQNPSFMVGHRNDLLDTPPQWGGYFRIRYKSRGDEEGGWQDQQPGSDTIPYFPVNQAALSLVPDGANLKVAIKTLTPSFKTFRVRIDGAEWTDSPAEFTWELNPGRNVLEAKSVNRFDVEGPVSTLAMKVLPTVSAVARGDGPIVIPAVAFTAEGGGASGMIGRHVEVTPPHVQYWYTPGHWLEWDLDAPAAGDYGIVLRCAAKFPTERSLGVNGQPVAGLEHFTLEPTGGWKAWRDVALPTVVPLRAGRNALRITCLGETSLLLESLQLKRPGRNAVSVEGTAFAREGGGKVQRAASDRDGYCRFWTDKGHWMEWTIDGAEPGRYEVFLRYATMYDAPRRLSMNGEVAEGLESFVMPLSGDWRRFAENKLPAPVQLKAGRNVLRMTSLGGKGINLNGILLASEGKKDIYIPAVTFTGEGGGHVTRTGHARHGHVHTWRDKGHWLAWTVEDVPAGQYKMTLRYASKAQALRELKVNGETAKGLESIALEPTGDWRAWKEMTLPAPIALGKGTAVLRLTCVGGGTVNMDEIRLEKAPTP